MPIDLGIEYNATTAVERVSVMNLWKPAFSRASAGSLCHLATRESKYLRREKQIGRWEDLLEEDVENKNAKEKSKTRTTIQNNLINIMLEPSSQRHLGLDFEGWHSPHYVYRPNKAAILT